MIAEKNRELIKKAKALSEAILKLKEEVADNLKTLPENPDIKVINKQCYTIKSSMLSKDLCLDPSYYRFSVQYEALANMIITSKAENVFRKLEESLATGWVSNSSEHSKKIRLHPEVIKNVRGIM
jgi:hypothetical protein